MVRWRIKEKKPGDKIKSKRPGEIKKTKIKEKTPDYTEKSIEKQFELPPPKKTKIDSIPKKEVKQPTSHGIKNKQTIEKNNIPPPYTDRTSKSIDNEQKPRSSPLKPHKEERIQNSNVTPPEITQKRPSSPPPSSKGVISKKERKKSPVNIKPPKIKEKKPKKTQIKEIPPPTAGKFNNRSEKKKVSNRPPPKTIISKKPAKTKSIPPPTIADDIPKTRIRSKKPKRY